MRTIRAAFEAAQKKEPEVKLIRYDAMCQAIDKAFDVDEVKEIHDKAIALEAYFRQAKNPEPERKACEIRLRAERKAGQLLSAMEKKRQPAAACSQYQRALTANQIGERSARYWQELGRVPDEEFEAAMAEPKKPSRERILSKNKPAEEPQRMYPAALTLWGMLRDFEDDLLTEDPKFLLSQMLDTMRTDAERLAPLVIGWLRRINE